MEESPHMKPSALSSIHASAPSRYVGRLAPSPTGALHIGNIRTFLYAWLEARSQGGTLRLRIEDLDHPKHKPGAAAQLIDDLLWLGFDWDGDVLFQQPRKALYQAARDRLAPHLYPCFCTRADIQRAQSAPHPGEVLRYPGTCRPASLPLTPETLANQIRTHAPQLPAWRFALEPTDDGRFTDAFAGPFLRTAAETAGDFVVARGDEAAYTLAVVVDDNDMGISHIVRGDDILPATPAQIVLYRHLGLPLPTFCHLPLVVGPDGRRLAKRHGDTRICTYRAAGLSPARLLSAIARACHWLAPGENISQLNDLLPRFNPEVLPKTPLVWSPDRLA